MTAVLDRARTPLTAGAFVALALGALAGGSPLSLLGLAALLLVGLLTLARAARARRYTRGAPPSRTALVADGEGAARLAEACAAPLPRLRRGGWSELAAAGADGDEQAIALHGAGALDADAVVEVGSLTKPVTGILLADLAAAGAVALEDPLSRFLPGLRPAVGSITLLDLATHGSGLPRLPGRLLLETLLAPPDPYAGWDDARLERALRSVRVRRRGRFRYSNLGAAALGHALARAAAADYGTLVVERVCRPLGMTRSGLAPVPEDAWAAGHDRAGLPVSPWHFDAFAGAGGLRSTPRDMLRLLRAQLDPAATPLAAALEAAQAPRRQAGRGERIGLGWLVRDGAAGRGPTHWHNGGTGGFGSFLAFDRGAGAGVVLLSTASHRIALDTAGGRLLERIVSERPAGGG